MNKNNENKTLVLHDTFLYKWGWERLIMMMWKALKSDIASGFFDKNSFDLRKNGFEGELIPISSPIFKSGFRHIKLKLAFYFKTKFLKKYDNIIFSWDCTIAVRNARKDAKKIYYCHTPPRYLYDQYDRYISKINPILKPAYILTAKLFKYLYEKDLEKFDLILTNSKNTQKRIKKFTWKDSKILYPPVDTDEFKFINQGDYFLSFARISEIKRVDKIVKAFAKMPDKKLIVIYWKNDPQKEVAFKAWEWHKNINFITLEDNSKLKDYIWNCLATIYIPVDEDFGMSPVESMSAWKPVIWVDEWWLKESIIHNKTWVLISPEAKIENIIDAVKYLTPEKCLEMKEACESRANDFWLIQFEKQLKKYIK